MTSFTEIDGIKVQNKIFTAKFACDYGVCKGSCCYASVPDMELNGGALSDYDAAEILYRRKEISELCDDEDKEIIVNEPVQKLQDEFFTTMNKDKCVFSCMKLGGCALKVAKQKGIIDTGIPLSCQLYPLLWEVRKSDERLVIGDIFGDFCKCGYEKGEREGIYMIDFLKNAIVRGFGEAFYDKLKEVQQDFL